MKNYHGFPIQAVELLNHSNYVVDSLAEYYINTTNSNLTTLKNQFSYFQPTHYCAQLDKIFINHFIDLTINGFQTMTSTQYQELSFLAEQCPLVSGDVCFKAATLLRQFGHDIEVNSDYSCLDTLEINQPVYGLKKEVQNLIKSNEEDDSFVSVFDLQGKILVNCYKSELLNKLCGLVPVHSVLIIKDQYSQSSKMIMPLCSGQ